MIPLGPKKHVGTDWEMGGETGEAVDRVPSGHRALLAFQPSGGGKTVWDEHSVGWAGRGSHWSRELSVDLGKASPAGGGESMWKLVSLASI